ncbi:ITGA9 isoform 4, partial [Pan troglodytes]
KKDSSSVIQFMSRAKVKVDPALRVVEIAHGNPEEVTMGFFRRRYKEIIEAEKNRKENEDSWDWVQKNQ